MNAWNRDVEDPSVEGKGRNGTREKKELDVGRVKCKTSLFFDVASSILDIGEFHISYSHEIILT